MIAARNTLNSQPSTLNLVGAANAMDVQPVEGQGSEWRWIHISPYGEFPNPAGLQIFGEEQARNMVADFTSTAAKLDRLFGGLPFYVGHPDADPATYQDEAAYAWIHKLEARNTGLWGQVKLTPEGQQLLDNRRYKFCSAYWLMSPAPNRRGAFHPRVLKSVGFTNNPNIRGATPVASNSLPGTQPTPTKTMNEEQLKALRKALGLAEAATEAEIIAAANAARAGLDSLAAANTAKAGADAKLEAATNEAKALKAELATANTAKVKAETAFNTERAARIETLLTGAVNSTRITAAQRDEWKGKLDADFDKASGEIAALKPALNTQSKTKQLGSRVGETSNTSGGISAINTAVSKHMKENGTNHHDAYMAVKADPANRALFEKQETNE